MSMHTEEINGLISAYTGLSFEQLEAARVDPSNCRGCYDRLVSLLNAGDFEYLRISRAIGMIKTAYPSISGSNLIKRNIEPILNCPNSACKCKKTWANLQSALAKRSKVEFAMAVEKTADFAETSKPVAHYTSSNNINKQLGIVIDMLEEDILNIETLHD